jgi:hypothetical protein
MWAIRNQQAAQRHTSSAQQDSQGFVTQPQLVNIVVVQHSDQINENILRQIQEQGSLLIGGV